MTATRWAKGGLLFEPPPPLPWASSHAALPVVDTAAAEPTLYFSTRDDRGRSLVARATLAFDPLRVVSFAPDPVLGLGALGAFDDSGVTTSCLVRDGSRLLLYYTGWTRGLTVPFTLFVGCAVSKDGGQTFARVSQAPLLERSAVDPFLTASPWVLVEDGLWRMWYVSCTGWSLVDREPKHRYHIRYAESDDGLRWRRDGLVAIDFRDEREYAIARPCVIRDDDRYRMWFSARGDAYGIGYAESPDGIVWDRRDDDVQLTPTPDGWDSEMQAYPLVFDHDGERWMFYNGNGYGRTGIGSAVACEAG